MKNIKLILVAVSLSLVSFNMASGHNNNKTLGSTTGSKAKAQSKVCNSCLTANKCISTIQDNVVIPGSDNNVQTSISSSCMQQYCANECPEKTS